MIYKEYGKTGKKVSTIGFGGMRFKNQDDVDECAELVHYAYEKGVNYFDTAIGYGKSEELLGTAFKTMLPQRAEKPFYVTSKTFKNSEDDVRKELETSLTRMGLDYLDFYHVWCILTWDNYLDRKTKNVLKAFEKMKEEGLVKHICVSTHLNGPDINRLLDDYPFEGILLGYSAANFAYRDEGLTAARDKGIGVVVMNPLAGGVIPQHPEKFDFLRSTPEESAVTGALRFLINDPRITVSLVGFSEKDHVDTAIEAVDGFQPISSERIAEIRENIKQAFDGLCTNCRYCDSCPQGIPVPRLMDAYNQFILSGETKDMLSRMRYHWGTKDDDDIYVKCTECGRCEKLCTQKLPIIQRIKEICKEVERSREATS